MQHEALSYAELGYRVFPVAPGGKVPIISGWNNDATTDPEIIERWIGYYSNANWGIATDGLLVVDVDPGAESWPQDEQQARELASTPVIATTPRGGRHYFFRQPEGAGLRNTQDGQLAEHVDTRADGGYAAVAPSTVNGNSYAWLNGFPDVGPAELPLPPRWVLDKLATAEQQKNKTQPADECGDGTIPEGRRNGSLTRLAGAMRRHGASEADIRAALLSANATRCKPPLDNKDVETIAHSVARYAPADVSDYLASLGADDLPDDDKSPEDPGALPADLLNVPGFIADVMAHNLAGAHKPQPVLALAGALSLLATLTGRKITDTQGTRTNLYCIGVAGTSTGKQRAREVNKDLLYLAGLVSMIGSESIGSAQGLVSEVSASPAILFQLDEMGRYLRTMGDAREAYLFNIVSVLMRMFTDSASIFKSDAVVDRTKIRTIHNPHACIYGTTTADALYNSLTVDSLQDGFLSRVLIFEGDDDVSKRWVNKPAIPPTLVDRARYWNAFQPGGNLSHVNPQPLIVESTPSARRIMYEYDTTAQHEQRRLGEPLGCLWPRAVEKANKLALLYACSENAQAPIVTDAAATWAVELVTHLTKRLAFLASRWVTENRLERGIKRLARIIEAAGPCGITKSALTRATRWLSKRERDEFIETLIETGEIIPRVIDGNRHSTRVYTHRRFVTPAAA